MLLFEVSSSVVAMVERSGVFGYLSSSCYTREREGWTYMTGGGDGCGGKELCYPTCAAYHGSCSGV